ncbi:MAG TPA: hypothetical protein VGM82_20545 [Gemmatimonadaceae bacterium]
MRTSPRFLARLAAACLSVGAAAQTPNTPAYRARVLGVYTTVQFAAVEFYSGAARIPVEFSKSNDRCGVLGL